MTTFAIDAIIIATVAYCGWRGYKNGLIRGVFGVFSLVASLLLAGISASSFSDEFTDMINPFVSGFVDSALLDIYDDLGDYDPAEFQDKPENFIIAYKVLRRMGLPESPSERIADMATGNRDGERIPEVLLSDYISYRLSAVLAFVGVFGVSFILLAIVFAVVGNLINFVFTLPGLAFFDAVSGAVFGTAKGVLIVLILATVVRYAGMLAPDIIEKTLVLKFIVNNNPIANVIGI